MHLVWISYTAISLQCHPIVGNHQSKFLLPVVYCKVLTYFEIAYLHKFVQCRTCKIFMDMISSSSTHLLLSWGPHSPLKCQPMGPVHLSYTPTNSLPVHQGLSGTKTHSSFNYACSKFNTFIKYDLFIHLHN